MMSQCERDWIASRCQNTTLDSSRAAVVPAAPRSLDGSPSLALSTALGRPHNRSVHMQGEHTLIAKGPRMLAEWRDRNTLNTVNVDYLRVTNQIELQSQATVLMN